MASPVHPEQAVPLPDEADTIGDPIISRNGQVITNKVWGNYDELTEFYNTVE